MATTGRGGGASPANVTKHLKGIDFPTDKQHLLKHAQQLHAEKVVIDEIQKMEDRQYGSMADVMKSFEPIPEEGARSRGRSESSSSGSSSRSQGSKSSHSKSSHR